MRLKQEESIRWIASRRSVFPKEFEEGSVSMTEIEPLLEAAKWAPTHKLTEPWRFSVIISVEKKNELISLQQEALLTEKGRSEMAMAKATKFRMIGEKSSAVIAIIMKRDPQERLPVNEELWSVACAVQNIHLHASSLNIGGYWSTGAMTNHPSIRKFLNLGEKDIHMGWFYLGRYTKEKTLIKSRLNQEEYVAWL
jgi:nitroreductase